MIRLRTRLPAARLPAWTAHPGFGVAALFGIAALLIAHGEPQPSSRPSGKSVVVSGSPAAPSNLPPVVAVHDGVLELREHTTVRRLTLPDQAVPRSVLTNRGLTVVMGAVDGRQRAYAVTAKLAIVDLGYADTVLPGQAPASVLIESAIGDPGRLPDDAQSPVTSGSASASTNAPSGPPALRDFLVRRYDSNARPLGVAEPLPTGMRAAADTAVGLVTWQPTNRVFDGTVPLEPLSARAVLLRPDGTQRPLGTVYPLAATSKELLVWDVVRRQFGLMPLLDLTLTGTTVPRPSGSRVPPTTARPAPSPTPTTVEGTQWFDRTRGFTVTGPASFSPDGKSFAVYAQVGSRRRLVVANVADVAGTNQVEVLALTAPVASATAPSTEPTGGPAATSGQAANSATASAQGTAAASPSPTPSASAAVFAPDGFPIRSASTPLWTNGKVIGVGTDGTVVSYLPGSDRAALLALGVPDLASLAAAP